jgi:hypothetical protein
MVLIAVTNVILTYLHIYPVLVAVGPLPFHHWMSISGASIIALLVPIYSVLKRRYPTIKELV